MTAKRKVPSAEDYARADKEMAYRARGLADVGKAITGKYRGEKWFHDVYILAQKDVTFRVYFFFATISDMVLAKESDKTKEIEEVVFQELKRVGRGAPPEITVAFEYDSHERVKLDFGGNYFYRLR